VGERTGVTMIQILTKIDGRVNVIKMEKHTIDNEVDFSPVFGQSG
jgi:hypothetical protein